MPYPKGASGPAPLKGRVAERTSVGDAAFMQHTASYQTRLERLSAGEPANPHAAAYQQVALEALWKGVRSTYGIDRNNSANAMQALQWGDRTEYSPPAHDGSQADAVAAGITTASTAHPRKRWDRSNALRAPAMIEDQPNLHSHPLVHYHQAQRENAVTRHALAAVLGITQTGSDSAAVDGEGWLGSNTSSRAGSRPASAYLNPSAMASKSRPTTASAQQQNASNTRPTTAYPSSLSVPSSRPTTAAPAATPYVPQKVMRFADGMVAPIGSFPAPTPLDPNDPAYANFRNNAWTTDQRFYSAGRELGEGSATAAASKDSSHFRDPGMDDPLYSSFSADRVFRTAPPPLSAAMYRCRSACAVPRGDGSYAESNRLFLQKLRELKAGTTQPKDEIRTTSSAKTVAALLRRNHDALEYETLLESEESKRARKDKADAAAEKAARAKEKQERAYWKQQRRENGGDIAGNRQQQQQRNKSANQQQQQQRQQQEQQQRSFESTLPRYTSQSLPQSPNGPRPESRMSNASSTLSRVSVHALHEPADERTLRAFAQFG